MDKRKIIAREILKDIRAGISDAELMEKYKISAQGLQSVFRKLVQAGVVTQTELDARVPLAERTVDLGLYICPACGNIQGKEFVECPRCGFVIPQKSKQTKEVKRDIRPQIKISPPDASEPAAPPQRLESGEENLATQSLRNLSRVVSYCRILGVGVLFAYIIAIGGIFVSMHFSDAATKYTEMELIAISLLGAPAVILAFIIFIILKALADSVRIFASISSTFLRNYPQ